MKKVIILVLLMAVAFVSFQSVKDVKSSETVCKSSSSLEQIRKNADGTYSLFKWHGDVWYGWEPIAENRVDRWCKIHAGIEPPE